MRKILGMLAVAALAAPVLPASAAQADIDLTQVTTSVGTVFVDGDAGCADRVKVTARVYQPIATKDDFYGVSAEVSAPDGGDFTSLAMPYESRNGAYAYYADWVFLCGADAPGRYRVHTELNWYEDVSGMARQATDDTSFSVGRPTSLTYNASPEPAKRGTRLTHSGRLLFDPFAPGAAYGPVGVKLTIAFKKAGSRTYVTKGSVVTGAGGRYTKKLRADADGTWRITYPGSATRQSQARSDYVDTK